MPTVRTNDAEIYYETHGQGQPFLFFSETACDGQIWKLYQVPEFAKDHMVIVHDYRGTGQVEQAAHRLHDARCFATTPWRCSIT